MWQVCFTAHCSKQNLTSVSHSWTVGERDIKIIHKSLIVLSTFFLQPGTLLKCIKVVNLYWSSEEKTLKLVSYYLEYRKARSNITCLKNTRETNVNVLKSQSVVLGKNHTVHLVYSAWETSEVKRRKIQQSNNSPKQNLSTYYNQCQNHLCTN